MEAYFTGRRNENFVPIPKSLTTSIELEGHAYSRLRSSEDFREGVEAFHAKRKPAFKGL